MPGMGGEFEETKKDKPRLHSFLLVAHFFTAEWSKQLHDPNREPTDKYKIGEKKWIRASTGFEPVTSANTGHIVSQVIFCGFYLSHEGNRWKNKWNYFAQRREASNCTILTVSPPIYVIGKKKPEKIQDFNGIRTRDLREYRCDALPTELWSQALGDRSFLWVLSFPWRK